ncbi:BAG domain-containing protein Samui [Hetaerina americana]|uniref:BAG domain-containing protein Samui n=1 Tax=Hetaerina americana TaxID=62018 RepID=UPI003A7F1A1E
MSFSFRDKGRLGDRLRGKTCDEILKELRDHLHHDRGMSFEPSPSWGGFSSSPAFARAGFPFMDQDMMSSPDMRAHFEDLASRHPEFAEHLRPTAWNTVPPETESHFFHPEAAGPNVYRQRHSSGGSGSGSYGEGEAIPIPVIHEDSGGGETTSSRSRTRKIPQYGMRNTVDLGESQKSNPIDNSEASRSQRSWSAPPDNRTQVEAPQAKRFVTKVEVNNSPVNPTAGGDNEATPASASNVSNPGKPPPFPKASGAGPAPQSTAKQGNVRHIPIFVEGRDEPVLPRSQEGQGSYSSSSSHSSSGFGQPNASYSYASASPGSHSSSFASSHSPSGSTRSQSSAPHPQASGPFPHASGPFHQASGPFHQAGGPFHQASGPFQQASGPFHQASGPFQQASGPFPQHSTPHPQASAPQKPKPETPPPQQQPPPPKQALPKDPIARVQAIVEEVNKLKNKVESFSGSRSDKEYIYLDEMLTRNLLKLDDIETEGKDSIRQARKEAIRLIERCISLLESKAPLPQETTGGETEISKTTDVVMDDKSGGTDVCEEMSQSKAVANGEADKVPSESMEVQQNLDSQEPAKSETVNTEVSTQESTQSETPMEVATGSGTEVKEEGMASNSEPESKPGESTQIPEVMEVIPENMSKTESQDAGASDVKPTETEVQMSGGEGDEKIAIDTATTDGANANSGSCDGNTDTADSNCNKGGSAVSEGNGVVDGAASVTTGQENAAGGEPVASDGGVLKKSDSNEPVSTQNAQHESVNVSKESESASDVTIASTDKPNVNDIPPVEAEKKEASS